MKNHERRCWATSSREWRRGPAWGQGETSGGDKGYFVQPTVFSDVTDDMKTCKGDLWTSPGLTEVQDNEQGPREGKQ